MPCSFCRLLDQEAASQHLSFDDASVPAPVAAIYYPLDPQPILAEIHPADTPALTVAVECTGLAGQLAQIG